MSSGVEEEVEELEDEDGTRKRKKRSLKDIQERVMSRRRHIGEDEDVEQDVLSPEHDNGVAWQVQDLEISQHTQEEDVADASTTVIPPASGPPALTPQTQPSPSPLFQPSIEDRPRSQSMTQQPVLGQSLVLRVMGEHSADPKDWMDVDQSLEYASPHTQKLDATMDELTNESQSLLKDDQLQVPNEALVRQEEEESTQDLIAEMRAMEDERTNSESKADVNPEGKLPDQPMQDVVIHVRSPEHSPEQEDGGNESDGGNWLDVPQITIEQPSRAASVRSESVLSDAGLGEGDSKRPVTRSRSRSQTPTSVRSSGSKRGKAKGKGKKPLEIPSPIQSRSGTPEQEPAPLLPTKGPLPTIVKPVLTPTQTSLVAELAEEHQRNEILQQELHSMHEQLKQIADQNSLLDSSSRQEVAELQSQRAVEKAAWEDERVAFQARISSLESAKALANKDCDFFRDQYGKASGFVTSVREENKELEKRIGIAESQTSTGVELVKSTFALRIKTLEDNARAWQGMAEFVIEKDRRTNDDIRRRAAEEPELRARCERQRQAIELDEERIEDLEAELMEKQTELNRANAEIIHRKTENDSLQEDLNEALIKLDRIGRQGDEPSQGDGHELLWCCKWDRASPNPCRGTFATLRDFQTHMQAHVYPLLPNV
ncbi:hypothetical protein CPB83DRAFT_105284 [Crepidotus variabilis]|uniref:C2H2-type domain-containing protein n=1 Tax=Crepidotus variabilis TaxID=179855 RepID=A0A9P6EMD3_9AGAR|nr:hypothetical protein CPB83DRAFT_105284 [Crepidotus variabilis]